MPKDLELLRTTRKNLLRITDPLSLDQLNHIPDHFNNNLIWNMGHIVVTQQLLCYKLAALPCHIPEEMIAKYRKGTRPEGRVEEEELQMIKGLMFSLLDQTEADMEQNIFEEYKDYETSYNVTLRSFSDALFFNHVHEGMHLGYCIALRKML